MKKFQDHTRMIWFVCGLTGGMMISYIWPSEPAHAFGDRDAGGSKFMIETVSTGPGNSDAVFVLDFLTGRLVGAAMNQQTGTFTQFYLRNIMSDFKLSPGAKPSFVMTSGQLSVATRGGGPQPAVNGLFIGELTSGRVLAYAFPFAVTPRVQAPEPLRVLDGFPFREMTQ